MLSYLYCMSGTKMRALFHPERFQGWGKTKQYFEGWYFKLVSADENTILAIIPGIAMDKKGEKHAFIQVLDGKQKKAAYHAFPHSDFTASTTSFDVQIGTNQFSNERIVLNLSDVTGDLNFENTSPWPNEWYSPGIMGPFSFVPFMQCKHGIVSLNHSIKGRLSVGDETISFDEGRGYIEKDWGNSFPAAYVWMQTNHFEGKKASLKLSVAKIPWLGSWFVGFIGGLWLNGELYQFTTYNGTRLASCKISDELVNVELRNKKQILHIEAHRDHATHLAAPIFGDMSGRIQESMTAKVKVTLVNARNKNIIFEGEGKHAGLEIAGDIELITT